MANTFSNNELLMRIYDEIHFLRKRLEERDEKERKRNEVYAHMNKCLSAFLGEKK